MSFNSIKSSIDTFFKDVQQYEDITDEMKTEAYKLLFEWYLTVCKENSTKFINERIGGE